MNAANPRRLIPTKRLFWDDESCFETNTSITGVEGSLFSTEATCFYPGGGGQPCDTGSARFEGGEILPILSAHYGENEAIWHEINCVRNLRIGSPVQMVVDIERRMRLAEYHTVLHILNTITLRDYQGWITGVQIGTDYSRIDFRIDRIPNEIREELEAKVNAIICSKKNLRSYFIDEAEFRQRTDLLRTLEAKPPVIEGRVRVVEIVGFDIQACGGTHVNNTSALGVFSIFKTENKGRINKRFYVRLTAQ